MASEPFIIRGNLVQIPSLGKLNVLKDAVIGVKEGKVVVVEEAEPGSQNIDKRCQEELSRAGIASDATSIIKLPVSQTSEDIIVLPQHRAWDSASSDIV